MELGPQQVNEGSRDATIGERGECVLLSGRRLGRPEKSWQDSFLRLLLPLQARKRGKSAALWVGGCEKKRRKSGQRGKVGDRVFLHQGRVDRVLSFQ